MENRVYREKIHPVVLLTYLKELAKQFRKLNGKGMPAQLRELAKSILAAKNLNALCTSCTGEEQGMNLSV